MILNQVRERICSNACVAAPPSFASCCCLTAPLVAGRQNVSLLVDVCRQCIVFREGRDLVKCLRAIRDDPDAVVVRVKNRLDPDYAARESGGYRDVLVNVRLETAETEELCAAGHVCEVQLLLQPFAEIKVRSLQAH